MSIKLVIAEDHALFRSGLKQLLSMQEDISIVGETGDGIEAVKITIELQPDILLLDISLPGQDGLSVIPLVKKGAPQTKILIISMHGVSEYIRSAFKSGADGYLLKTADSDEFFVAINAVLRGSTYVSSELTTSILDSYLHKDTEETVDLLKDLTDREKEILRNVAQGMSNKEISQELNIAEKTVITHRTNFMRKLSLHNVQEITLFAVRNNLISLDGV